MKNTNRPRLAAAAAVGVGALCLATVGSSVAMADPGSPATTGHWAAVGSDTIESVLTELSTYHSELDNWDAFGPGYTGIANAGDDEITTKVGGSTFGRPHGSGEGVEALSAAWNIDSDVLTILEGPYNLHRGPGDADVDIARSSSRPSTVITNVQSTSAKLAYIPFARDAVAYAIKDPGDVLAEQLTGNQIAAIFGRNINGTDVGTYDQDGDPDTFAVGDIIRGGGTSDPELVLEVDGPGETVLDSLALHPVLPQDGSGTRSFFLAALGLTTGTVGSWVVPGVGIEENNADELTAANELVPFSVAQWIAQKNGVETPDTTDGTSSDVVLGSPNNVSPTVPAGSDLAPNPTFYGDGFVPAPVAGDLVFYRDTFLVVPIQSVRVGPTATAVADEDATPLATFVSQTLPETVNGGSQLVVEEYGFLGLGYSSDINEWLYSPYTN